MPVRNVSIQFTRYNSRYCRHSGFDNVFVVTITFDKNPRNININNE